jgi:hypothetical protein
VQRYYNPNSKYAPPNLMDSNNPTIGYANSNISLNNGILNCFITRKKSMATKASMLKATTNNFDITANKYYILFATGSTSSNSKKKKKYFNLSL